GWIPAPGYQYLHALVTSPLTRIYLFALCFLALFHWAHRFRYTLYDGLQIKLLNELIFVCCYGGAIFGTALAGYLLWNFHLMTAIGLRDVLEAHTFTRAKNAGCRRSGQGKQTWEGHDFNRADERFIFVEAAL